MGMRVVQWCSAVQTESHARALPVGLLCFRSQFELYMFTFCQRSVEVHHVHADRGSIRLGTEESSPRSLILKTPVTLELVLRCLGSFGGDDDNRPSMAESTLVRGEVVSTDMIVRGG
jgi:hypothetical protein